MQKNLCPRCKNYIGNLKCFAFSNGISNDIVIGENNHTKPLKGQDNDIVFEQIKEE